MLVLMRRKGETIRIGENITVTILSVSRGQVSVGVRAPRDVVVDREEVHQRRVAGHWTRQKQRDPGP